MRGYIFMILGLFLSNFLVAQSVTTASAQKTPIVLDGRDNDWPERYRFTEYNSRLLYNISNDNTNLYFCFRSDERSTITKMLRYGIVLQIDTNGKKKSGFELFFPASKKGNKKADDMPHPNRSQLMLSAKQDLSSYIVKGAIGLQDGEYPLNENNGISMAFDFDSVGGLICEWKIALDKIQTQKSNKPWILEFKINAPSKAPDVSKMNTSGISSRNNISNPSMNQNNTMGSMPGNQTTNGMMMNNTPIEPVEDEQQQHAPMMTVEMEKMFESSNWKIKFLLSE
jgi:hypothetical protein